MEVPEVRSNEAVVSEDLDRALRKLKESSAPSTVTVVYEGRGVGAEKVVELKRVRPESSRVRRLAVLKVQDSRCCTRLGEPRRLYKQLVQIPRQTVGIGEQRETGDATLL